MKGLGKSIISFGKKAQTSFYGCEKSKKRPLSSVIYS